MASRRWATFFAKSTISSSAGLLPTTPLKAKADEAGCSGAASTVMSRDARW